MGGDENRLLSFGGHVDRSRFDHRVLMTVMPTPQSNARLGDMIPAYDAADIALEIVGTNGIIRRRTLGAQLVSGMRATELVFRLARLFRRERIDVVDARLHYPMALGLAAGRLAGVPAIVGTGYFHGLVLEKPLLIATGRAVISRLDALISDSQFAIDGYQNWLPRPHPRAVVIPNGIPIPQSKRSRPEMRRHFGLPEAATVVGQVSRIVPHKGHLILIRAIAPLMAERPDLHLLICGFAEDQMYLKQLHQEAAKLNVRDHVHIAGYPGPIADVWTTIDVQAHASLLDSSPIAIHEGMAVGLPAVVTDEGGARELVVDGETGLVVPKGDEDALRRGLRAVLSNAELSRRLAAGAKGRYHERHRPEVMSRAHEVLFRSIVEQKRRRTARRLA